MRKRVTIRRLAGRLAVAATLLTLCCGFGHSIPSASDVPELTAPQAAEVPTHPDGRPLDEFELRIWKQRQDSVAKWSKQIDYLIERHDLCKNGINTPDSAGYYAGAIMELAMKCYDVESDEFINIYTDYFLPAMADFKFIIVDHAYHDISRTFKIAAPKGWRPYYKLGNILASYNEHEKAKEMYRIVADSSTSAVGRVYAGMELAKYRYREAGANLEEEYLALIDDFKTIESPKRESILIEIAIDLSDYFLKTGNDEKAWEYLMNGETLKGWVPDYDIGRLMRNKYEYLCKRDHIKAVECLDEAIRMSGVDDDDDKEWIAMALIDRGDYCWNELANIVEASKFYLKAAEIAFTPFISRRSYTYALVARLIYFLTADKQYDQAIEFGEQFLYKQLNPDPLSPDLQSDHYRILLEVIEAYFEKGDIKKAQELLDLHGDWLAHDERTRRKTTLLKGRIQLANEDYASASETFSAILEDPGRWDIGQWAQRYLATAYSYLDDSRKNALSDSINITTKRRISTQFWLIPPRERVRWLQICIEATQHQLSLPNNPRAVRNAAELNLFRKGLLFRTDAHIGRIFSGIPEADAPIALLDSFRNARIEAMNRGDSGEARSLSARADSLRQSISTLFLDADLLMKEMESPLEEVAKHLGKGKIALDFLADESHGELEIGAFLYSHDADPVYVPIYRGSIPDSTDLPALIWKPLIPYVKKAEEVYFCADERLNTIPIEFLPFAEERSLDGVRLHRVFHLSQINPPTFVGDSSVFVGVSDYGSATSSDKKEYGWSGLEGTDSELESMRRNFPSASVGILMNEQATERNIRELDKSSVSTLHFSTHGVFRSHEGLAYERDSLPSTDSKLTTHWLAVCDGPLSALALPSSQDNDGQPADDLLTAEEVELMSFPNLSLTVLSACDTGLGTVDFEGVWGLQRAFRIAGTKSLICSLTKVDDYWTAWFMDAFYERTARGESVYDAFRAAQRQLRRELPDNPEVWSSFILIE